VKLSPWKTIITTKTVTIISINSIRKETSERHTLDHQSDFSFPTVTNDSAEQTSVFGQFCLLIREEQPSAPANR
jgi:hypothetical protein